MVHVHEPEGSYFVDNEAFLDVEYHKCHKANQAEEHEDSVQMMTLHSAKGLEFPLVFLPGWEEGVFPSQKSMDESGLAGLEEERRLAYVGITRAREHAKIFFAANRQIYGSWQSSLPSRFIDELPPAHVEAQSETGYYEQTRFASQVTESFSESFDYERTSPGWKRYQANKKPVIEGRAVRRNNESTTKNKGTNFKVGERIFHQKFGYGAIKSADGNKLEVAFEKAGKKKVIDSFVERA